MFLSKTLYKTQIHELKEECDERNKKFKALQQRVAEYKEERWVKLRKKKSSSNEQNEGRRRQKKMELYEWIYYQEGDNCFNLVMLFLQWSRGAVAAKLKENWK